jgi:hypothetical protein
MGYVIRGSRWDYPCSYISLEPVKPVKAQCSRVFTLVKGRERTREVVVKEASVMIRNLDSLNVLDVFWRHSHDGRLTLNSVQAATGLSEDEIKAIFRWCDGVFRQKRKLHTQGCGRELCS